MMPELWIVVAAVAVFVCGGVLVAMALRHDRSAHHEPGAPESEVLGPDNTTPIEGPVAEAALALTLCPHDVPLSRFCERCDRQWKAPHVTLDDDTPKGTA